MPAPFDEASVDTAYTAVMDELGRRDLGALGTDIERQLWAEGVSFGFAESEQPFVVDPVPRIIGAAEWNAIAAGLAQRVRALESFVTDAYGRQDIVSAGVVPAGALSGASYYEPQLAGLDVKTWIPVAGLDLVRDARGTFRVLEDNLRTPSGLAYALATRRAVGPRIPVPSGRRLESLEDTVTQLGAAIAALAAPGVDEPNCVLLSDGPANSAFYEHRVLARLLDYPLVGPEQLEQSGGRLFVRLDGRRIGVDVVYRRADADRLFDPDGRPTALAELMLEPLRRGRLGIANGFGAGVADDKLLHGHVEDMVRFYLDEEPLLPSVVTWDLSRPEVLASTLERLDQFVIKPRDGHGGQGVVIGPMASSEQLRAAARALAAEPESFVAQDPVMLSVHPTVCGGRLAARHVDLRPFVLTVGDTRHVVPGGLTRVALEEGSLVVNSSRQGGAKDTWVLS